MCATYYGGIMKHPAETSTECRRTTRFSTILADLYRDAASETRGPAGGIGQVAGPRGDPREPHTKPPGECASAGAEIGMGEILDRAHHAGFGFVAALLALVSIPLVGLTVPFGLAVASKVSSLVGPGATPEEARRAMLDLQKSMMTDMEAGILPSWFIGLAGCLVLMLMLWVAGVVLGILAVRRPVRRRTAVAALVTAGLLPLLICLGSSMSL